MSVNPFDTRPLCIAQVHPLTRVHVRAFFFLGNVPKSVLSAARRGRAKPNRDVRYPEWDASDMAILRSFYGLQWQTLLTAVDPPSELSVSAAPSRGFFTGGDEIDFGDMDDIDNIDDIVISESSSADSDTIDWGTHQPSPPTYTDVATFPEDTIFDLRKKLTVASGIPIFRQHLFYYVNDEGPILPYRFTLDGAPILVDWRDLATMRGTNSHQNTIAGLTVDVRFEERREGIHITALDTFRSLSYTPGARVTHAYYVDLFDVIPPIGAPERPNDNLPSVLNDKYQFDILYHGVLIKYWPQLSPDSAKLALSNPKSMRDNYPALDPDQSALALRVKAGMAIADAATRWRAAASKGTRDDIAVTSATVRITPDAVQMRVAVRNVFDWVPTSTSVSAVIAQFNVDASVLPDGIYANRRGGLIPITASKRHISSYGLSSETTISKFLKRTAKRDAVTFALARESLGDVVPSCTGRIPYAYLTIKSDGTTESSGDWCEDDRIGFDYVIDDLNKVTAPTIKFINEMGASAFPVGGILYTGGKTSKRHTTLGSITASVFWPHALSTSAFRDVKTRFRQYQKAGIVEVRGLQRAGAYTFMFKRGIIWYDPRLADRAEAGMRTSENGASGIGVRNQYAWLTNESVAARWALNFQGRTVRMYHRATDLKIEVINANGPREFDMIRRYLFAFLDGLLTGPSKIKIGTTQSLRKSTDVTPASGSYQRLKRLRERDPNLFDLKKYDPDVSVYSMMCQSKRQPHVYNSNEVSKLSATASEKLVEYWNFTDNVPAFYSCPDSGYPHLRLKPDKHPLGYCLPCCQQTQAAPDSRAGQIDRHCLSRNFGDGGKSIDEVGRPRHVLAYGKNIRIGRISEVPSEISEGLFLGALPKSHRLHLVGVEQSVPAVPDAGFAYALAYVAGIGGGTTDDTITELANIVLLMDDTYHSLGDGAASAFTSAQALSDAILSAFVRRDSTLSPFGPGGVVQSWKSILTELVRYAFGIEIVVLNDESGRGSVLLEIDDAAASAICNISSPKIALIVTGPTGTYPIVAVNPRLFLRTDKSDRWMVTRKVFILDSDESSGTINDNIAKNIREAVYFIIGSENTEGAELDLDAVIEYAQTTTDFKLTTQLINMSNQCYGVILVDRNDQSAYIPIKHSAFHNNDILTAFGPRPRISLPVEVLRVALESINTYIVDGKKPYAPIKPETVITNPGNAAIGFISGTLYYYHDADLEPSDNVKTVRFPYDSVDIDSAMVEYVKNPNVTYDSKLASHARSRNQLYRLFLAEFSALLSSERNTKIRSKITALIRTTRFGSTKSVAHLRANITKLLFAMPDDLRLVRDVISRSFVIAPCNTRSEALRMIELSVFAFDHNTLEKLQKFETHMQTIAHLRKILASRITVVDDGDIREAPNMYTSCSESTSVHTAMPHCANNKLAVPTSDIDNFYELLAADVRNLSKTRLLAAVSTGVFNTLNFIRRAGEHLTVLDNVQHNA